MLMILVTAISANDLLANQTIESTTSQPLSSQSEAAGSITSNDHSGELIYFYW